MQISSLANWKTDRLFLQTTGLWRSELDNVKHWRGLRKWIDMVVSKIRSPRRFWRIALRILRNESKILVNSLRAFLVILNFWSLSLFANWSADFCLNGIAESENRTGRCLFPFVMRSLSPRRQARLRKGSCNSLSLPLIRNTRPSEVLIQNDNMRLNVIHSLSRTHNVFLVDFTSFESQRS